MRLHLVCRRSGSLPPSSFWCCWYFPSTFSLQAFPITTYFTWKKNSGFPKLPVKCTYSFICWLSRLEPYSADHWEIDSGARRSFGFPYWGQHRFHSLCLISIVCSGPVSVSSAQVPFWHRPSLPFWFMHRNYFREESGWFPGYFTDLLSVWVDWALQSWGISSMKPA